MVELPKTAKGVARLATPEEIAREAFRFFLACGTSHDTKAQAIIKNKNTSLNLSLD